MLLRGLRHGDQIMPGGTRANFHARRRETSRVFRVHSLGLFVALAAIELRTYPLAPALGVEYPFSIAKRRIVPHVLPVPALQHRTPMRLIVEFEFRYLLFHRFFT